MTDDAVTFRYRTVHGALEKFNFGIRVAPVTETVLATLQHSGQVGAVGIMTGAAHLLGKGIMHFRRRQCCLGLGMTGEAKFAFRSFGQQLLIIRCVRFVAGEAPVPFGHRHMRVTEPVPFFGVALHTDAISFSHQELGAGSGMGIVTGKAFPLLERGMLDRPAGHQFIGIVTLTAELGTGIHGRKRLVRVGRIVAGVAHSFLGRRMDAAEKQIGRRCRVGIVTRGALCLANRVTAVSLAEF